MLLCCLPPAAIVCAEPQATGSSSIVSTPKVQRLDWNGIGGLITIQSGARLRMINLNLANFATELNSEDITAATPWTNVGAGPGIAPTFNLAPGAVVSCCGRKSTNAPQRVWSRDITVLTLVLLNYPTADLQQLGRGRQLWCGTFQAGVLVLCSGDSQPKLHTSEHASALLHTLASGPAKHLHLHHAVSACCTLQFVGMNLTADLLNPSSTPGVNCPRYTERSRSVYAQVRVPDCHQPLASRMHTPTADMCTQRRMPGVVADTQVAGVGLGQSCTSVVTGGRWSGQLCSSCRLL